MSAGTLFVVATPIGNLEDITLRALRVLREADVIAAEDTRRTSKLLAHHGITTSTVSFHEHNARTRLPQLIHRLQAGESVAVVTDAGTPGVSDPGVELVRACIEANIPIDPVPGASAPLTAAVASGFTLDSLTVFGFPPLKGNARTNWLSVVSENIGVVTFFEAPHRIERTLTELGALSGNRPIMLGRELTKVHQEFLRGTAAELLSRLGEPRGEYTVVVGPPDKSLIEKDIEISDDELASEFGQYPETAGGGRREVITALARKYGKSTREVYAAIERAKRVEP